MVCLLIVSTIIEPYITNRASVFFYLLVHLVSAISFADMNPPSKVSKRRLAINTNDRLHCCNNLSACNLQQSPHVMKNEESRNSSIVPGFFQQFLLHIYATSLLHHIVGFVDQEHLVFYISAFSFPCLLSSRKKHSTNISQLAIASINQSNNFPHPQPFVSLVAIKESSTHIPPYEMSCQRNVWRYEDCEHEEEFEISCSFFEDASTWMTPSGFLS